MLAIIICLSLYIKLDKYILYCKHYNKIYIIIKLL